LYQSHHQVKQLRLPTNKSCVKLVKNYLTFMTDSSFIPLQTAEGVHDRADKRLSWLNWKKAVTACHKNKIPMTVKFPVGAVDHQAIL
jgi:hypothetical protein